MNKIWFLLLVTLSLVSCQQAPAVTELSTQVAPLRGRTCTLSSLEANPAGLHRSGSVGGVGLLGSSKTQPLAPTPFVAGQIESVFPVSEAVHDVVLIIADDFGKAHSGKSVYHLGSALYQLRYSDYPGSQGQLLEPYPQWLEAKLKTFEQQGHISHGALVMTHTLGVLEALGADLIQDSATQVRLRLGQANVRVRAVEVSGLDTLGIRNVLKNVVESYPDGTRFVFNMSFTLEPCSAVQKFRASGDSSFDGYLSATPPGLGPDDPLRRFTEGETRRGVFVAAAGNFGGDEPRQPGKLSDVVSVSAARGTTETLFTFSNRAEVRTAGGWLRLGDPFGRNGVGKQARGVIVTGTSFASPNVAIASMLDLGAAAHCVPEGSASLLAHGAYTDESLGAARATFCSP